MTEKKLKRHIIYGQFGCPFWDVYLSEKATHDLWELNKIGFSACVVFWSILPDEYMTDEEASEHNKKYG